MNVLKTMRTMNLLKLLLWVIVISFIMAMFTLWGGGLDYESKGGHSLLGRDYSVKVGADTLPPGVFSLKYRFYVNQMKQMLGENYDKYKDSFMKGAPQRIANSLVDQLILADLGKSLGLEVSDQEVAATIARIYKFTDPASEYPVILSRMGVSAEEYEAFVRNELMVQKVNGLIADANYFNDKQLRRMYVDQNEKIKALLVTVPTNKFFGQVARIPEQEVKARYDKTKATLKTPEKRRISYVKVSKAQLRKKLSATEEQVKQYYRSHLADFSTRKGERRASHILIKALTEASPKEQEAAKKKAEEILQMIKAGADFGKMAQAYSEDPSNAKNGGDLGWFSRDRMVKPFADAVFDQAKTVGEVIGPVKTIFGYHIIKLTGIGGAAKPYEEVKAQVKQALLLKDPAFVAKTDKLFEEAKKTLGAAADDKAVKAAAKEAGVAVVPVPMPISRDDFVPGIGKDETLIAAIFKAPKGQWSDPVEVKEDWIRFKLEEVSPAHPSSYDEARMGIFEAIRKERMEAMAKAETQTLLTASKNAADLEARAKKAGYEAKTTEALTKEDKIPGIGGNVALSEALFSTQVGSSAGPFEVKGAWIGAIVTEHTPADMAKFEKERSTFDLKQRQRVAGSYIQDYVARRREALEKADAISYNTSLIKKFEKGNA